jgi:pimeloyl-ACP methyl ester carboxylesterase
MRSAGLAAALCIGACAGRAVPTGPAEISREAIFTRASPLSRSAEIGRRVLTPLTFAAGQQAIRARSEQLREQAIDPARESFGLFVPAGAPPPQGWGLLVFVSPWNTPADVRAWRATLTRRRMIFVSPAGAGNETSVVDRRLPLALLALENVRAEFPLDPDRVYVGGLSGGSRVAEIAALAYPDVFRGALLNAGSEPIGGENRVYLPPADLFRRFQRSRLVFATGEHDEEALRADRLSRSSMREWCVQDVDLATARQLGHEPLDSFSFERALDALDARRPAKEDDLARCNAGIEAALAAELGKVEAALARGDVREARALLLDVDRRYAGLAGEAILALDAKIKAAG